MKFSLINVQKEYDGKVDGSWVQDHHGDLESARKWKQQTEKANGSKVNFAVIPFISSSTPGAYCYNKIRLI